MGFNSAFKGLTESVYRLGYGLDGPGLDLRQGKEIFSETSTTALEPTQRPAQWAPGFFPVG